MAELGGRERAFDAPHQALDTSHYVIDGTPLPEKTEFEIRSRLSAGRDAVVLVDHQERPYAVMLRPSEFNLLLGSVELAFNAYRYVQRSNESGRIFLSPAQFKERIGR